MTRRKLKRQQKLQSTRIKSVVDFYFFPQFVEKQNNYPYSKKIFALTINNLFFSCPVF